MRPSTDLRSRATVPFVVTIVVGLLLSTYLLFDPARWLQRLMQLTDTSMEFKAFLLGLAMLGFGCSWMGEKFVLPRLAKRIGWAKQRLRPWHRQKRKQYKVLLEQMRL